jgi:hypothetical protein
MDVIAKALDQALADGAERGALDRATMVNSGAITMTTNAAYDPTSPTWTNGNGHANPDDYSELPMYMGAPVEFDRLNDPHVVPLDEHMRGYDPAEVAKAHAHLATNVFEDPLPVEAPKKRRGRPPGSKAKAAKPARAKRSKSDKLLAKIAQERAPVLQALADAPVVETVAPVAATVAETTAEASA